MKNVFFINSKITILALILTTTYSIFTTYILILVQDLRRTAYFLSEEPNITEVIKRFGNTSEVYQNTDLIEQTGWGIPPWKWNGKIYVFFTKSYDKIFVAVDEEGTAVKFWISSS